IESGVLLEEDYQALLGSEALADEQEAAAAAAAVTVEEAAAVSEKDKKDLEVVELLVSGVMNDLVDSSDLDEEVRNFFF
ncbi:hypothetical protein KR084_010606, partial [Drosophila pseudotakahashii]